MLYESIRDFWKQVKNLDGSLLGVDLGTKKTGLAISDPLLIISSPLENVRNCRNIVDYIVDLYAKKSARGIVIGLPLELNGTEKDFALYVRSIALEVSKKQIHVLLHDERMSTKYANRIAESFGRKNQKFTDNDDKFAAHCILEEVISCCNKIKD